MSLELQQLLAARDAEIERLSSDRYIERQRADEAARMFHEIQTVRSNEGRADMSALYAAREELTQLKATLSELRAKSAADAVWLREQLETAQKDTARLDWMESAPPYSIGWPSKGNETWSLYNNDDSKDILNKPTLRAAIDAAIATH